MRAGLFSSINEGARESAKHNKSPFLLNTNARLVNAIANGTLANEAAPLNTLVVQKCSICGISIIYCI